MEDSVNSCNDERRGDDDFDESGWTMYLEDFFANNNIDDNGENYSSFSVDNSHLVSDAASLVMNKSDDGDCGNEQISVGLSIDNYCKSYNRRLSLIKKRRTIGPHLVDDALEDTASSPANSPKVYDLMNQFNKNTKQKRDNSMNISQEKRNIGSSSHVVDERRDDVGFIRGESESAELKKRGLCLVPLSMVVNYFG